MKKFELTTDSKMVFGRKLFRIKALISFGDVKKDELGGWVEKEQNLSHSGNAWVSGDARVFGNAWVFGNARVFGDAQVSGDAWVFGDAQVYGNARVFGDARVYGNADHIVIGPIGSRNAYTTFYRRADGETMVVCGCFHDSLIAFEERVAEVHGDNQHGKMYMAAIEFVRKVINMNAVSEGKEGDTQ